MTRIIRHAVQAAHFSNELEKHLPPVRGRLSPNFALKQMTWLNAGGPAEVLFKPADKQDLIDFVKNCPRDVPITTLGVISNVIIRDGGIPGVTIRMGREFAHIDIKGDKVHAGAAAIDMNVALTCLNESVAGLEFLSGIPGTIGGGLRMNAGAYGTEFKDVLETAEVLDRSGNVRHLTPAEMGMTYRRNALPEGVIFISGVFKGRAGVAAEIEQKMMEIKDRRAESQPIRTKTGGSTFANPPEGGKKAWELIDAAGCRGLTVGGAQMSEMHCNFMINTGTATSSDLENLGEEVRRRVYGDCGIQLRWEIRRIGAPAPEGTKQ